MINLKITFISALLKIQNTILLSLQKTIWRTTPSKVSNILIYKNGNIGDIIIAFPTIKAIRLKYPDAKITFFTSPGPKTAISAAHLFESQNLVNELIYYYDGKVFPFFSIIRQRNFDLCFVMSDDRTVFLKEIRNLFFFALLKIKYLYGFSVNRIKFFETSFAQKIPYPYKNEVERNLQILNFPTNQIDQLFSYSLLDNDISNKIFDVTKISNNTLIIATGAKLKSKQWDKNNFFEIAKLWLQNKGDVLFIGDKKDSEDADIMIGKLEQWKMRTELMFESNNWYNLCNKTTLDESIFLIQKSVAMIANDSGAAHFSSLTNTKIVTIQAPRDFKLKWDPYFSKELVLRPSKTPLCRCSLDSCGYCINDITHNDVWHKLKGFA